MIPISGLAEREHKLQRMLRAIEDGSKKYPDFDELRPTMRDIAEKNPWMDQSNDVEKVVESLYLEAKMEQNTATQFAAKQLAQLQLAALQQKVAQSSGAWGYSTGVPPAPSPKYEGAYNKDTPCKACGENGPHASTFVSDTVRHVKEPGSGPRPVTIEYEDKDRSLIRRTCTNCGHTWNEVPIYLVPELVAERMLGGQDE